MLSRLAIGLLCTSCHVAGGLFDSPAFSVVSSGDDAVPAHDPSQSLRGKRILMLECHRSTIKSFLRVAESFGIEVDVVNWSGHQDDQGHFLKALGTKMRVLNISDALTLGRAPNQLREAFYAKYRRPFQVYDAFVCSLPAAMCELFLPFDQPSLIWLSVPLEYGRENYQRWAEWLEAFRAIAASPRSVIGAMTRHAGELARYFSAVPYRMLPSVVDDIVAEAGPYQPSADYDVLLGKFPTQLHWRYAQHGSPVTALSSALRAALNDIGPPPWASGYEFMARRYPRRYSFADLVKHPAILYVPYNVGNFWFREVWLAGLAFVIRRALLRFLLELV